MTAASTDIDFTQVRVGFTGHIKYAPLGSTVPTDVTTEWDAAWIDLGTIDDKGITRSHKKTMTKIMGWQSTMPVRQSKQQDEYTYKFTAIQMNWSTAALWADAGPTVKVGEVWVLTVPVNAPAGEYMIGIEWEDGTFIYREFTERGVFSDSGDMSLSKGSGVLTELTYETLPIDDATSVVTTLTNDPSFAAS